MADMVVGIDLRRDLEAALALVAKIKAEKEEYRFNYEELHEQFLLLQEANTVEKHQIMINIELEKQAKKHEEEVSLLNADIDKYRAAYFDLRGEAERLKAQADAGIQLGQHQQASQLQIQALSREVADLQDQLQRTSANEANAKAALEEKHKRVLLLESEVSALDATLTAEKQSFISQLDSLKGEIRDLTLKLTQQSEQAVHASRETQATKARLEETINALRQELGDAKLSLKHKDASHSRSIQELQAKIDAQHVEIRVAERSASQAQEALRERELEHVQELHGAREEEWAKLRAMEAAKMEAERDLVAATSRADAFERQLASDVSSLQRQLDASVLEKDELQREVKRLSGKDQQLTRVQREFEAFQKQVTEQQAASQSSNDRKLAAQETECASYKRDLSALRERFSSLLSTAEAQKTKHKEQKRRYQEEMKRLQADLVTLNAQCTEQASELTKLRQDHERMKLKVCGFKRAVSSETRRQAMDAIKMPLRMSHLVNEGDS
eukprot:m.16534 g.16534  ORF g.16534 m.16534 type:complete len:500 (+) comp7107_c0_seq2:185-1684(+)